MSEKTNISLPSLVVAKLKELGLSPAPDPIVNGLLKELEPELLKLIEKKVTPSVVAKTLENHMKSVAAKS